MARDLIVDGELVLYGPVGGDLYGVPGFTAWDVIQALAQLDGDITVRLNSGGGDVWDGVAIFNALKARPDPVTVIVDGVAASAASVIAMAGNEITMRTGALMMIHETATITWGTADAHGKSVDLLRKLDGQIAAIYAARTGMDLAEIRALMVAETWMDGAEAIDMGFAGASDQTAAAKASAFDYLLYAHAPKPLQSAARKLKASTAAQPWGVPLNAATLKKKPTIPAAAAAPPEVKMTDTTTAAAPAANDNSAEAVKADRARVSGILNHAEAQGREALAKHLAFETDMGIEAAGKALALAHKATDAAATEESPQAHAARRAAAGGLADPASAPKAPAAKGDVSILAAAVTRANKRR